MVAGGYPGRGLFPQGGFPVDLPHPPAGVCDKRGLGWAVREATEKKQRDFSKVEFFSWEEGLCVQCMHIGPYDDEPATVAAMEEYATGQGYGLDFSQGRFHHEIYLSDVRRCKPEKLKNRHPAAHHTGRVRKEMNTIIRKIRPEEYSLLREFLYQAIYLPVGVVPPPRSVIDLPELHVYIADFGTQSGDHCMVAEAEGKVVGAAWCRIMEDYGHIDSSTPSFGHLITVGVSRAGDRDAAIKGAFTSAPGERVSAGIPLRSEGKPGPAPLPADGIPYRGGERYRIFNALGRHPRGQQENMNMEAEKQRESKIRQWFSMWLDKHDTGIEQLFAPDAVYIESWGPEYHGSGKIKLWFDEWNTRGTVERWDIRRYFHKEEQTVVEWAFRCVMTDGTVQGFDGLSLIRWNEAGQICFLQEFGCNENRYDPYAQGDTPVFREEQALWF